MDADEASPAQKRLMPALKCERSEAGRSPATATPGPGKTAAKKACTEVCACWQAFLNNLFEATLAAPKGQSRQWAGHVGILQLPLNV